LSVAIPVIVTRILKIDDFDFCNVKTFTCLHQKVACKAIDDIVIYYLKTTTIYSRSIVEIMFSTSIVSTVERHPKTFKDFAGLDFTFFKFRDIPEFQSPRTTSCVKCAGTSNLNIKFGPLVVFFTCIFDN
jgi:hypothetical protein